jgi:hypothetical protein
MPTLDYSGGLTRLRRTLFMLIERFRPDETTIMVIVAVFVGLMGGFGAIAFRFLVNFFQTFAIGSGEDTVALLAIVPWWKKMLLPVAAVKIVASALTIAFGGPVGREGPIVQIGAGLGSTLGQQLRYSPQRLRTLIACGAAAGIAATFNAPIAGAFFALEILTRDFAVVTFSPIIVASVVATAVSREFLGGMLGGAFGAALIYRAIMKDTIFTLKFARRGQELSYSRESAILHRGNLNRVLIADDICQPVPDIVYRRDNLEDCLLRPGHRDTSDLPVLYSPERPDPVGEVGDLDKLLQTTRRGAVRPGENFTTP